LTGVPVEIELTSPPSPIRDGAPHVPKLVSQAPCLHRGLLVPFAFAGNKEKDKNRGNKSLLEHFENRPDNALPPRHSARPFHRIRSSMPPHPPITQAPDALPPTARATSFALSPVPSSLLLSSSPAPPSTALAKHSALHYLLRSVVHYAAHARPQRPEEAPATSPKRQSPLEHQNYRL
jgi:hypothetical protein